MLIVKNKYIKVPLVKIIVPFVLGTLTGIYFYKEYLIHLAIIVTIFYLVHYLYVSNYNNKLFVAQKLKLSLSVISFLAIFFTAYLLSIFYDSKRNEQHYSNYIKKNEQSLLQIDIIETPIEKERSFKIIAKVNQVFKENKTFSTSGKIIIYLEKKANLKDLKYGEILFIKSYINEIEEPKNPNEFNYKNYLKYHNIHFQTYVKTEFYTLSNKAKNKNIVALVGKFKEHLQKIIDKYIYGENERAVVSALLLGNRNLLNEDILKSFSSSGATHILAVSGLHVGIFFTLLSLIFRKLRNSKRFWLLHPIIIILFIWFYVLLTGGSPSVMRAALMYSLMAISISLDEYFSIYNTIAASAIILIVINPFIVTEVGFQLSYFAVIGIIYLQPRIYKIFVFRSKILDWIWAISTVSLAAQISTLPLILLYFHQFPNLFFISNLFVIPAAAIILYGGIILFIFSFFEPFAIIVGHSLSFIVHLLNSALEIIKNIPFALSTGLYISHLQALLIYLFIIWLSVAMVKRSKILFTYTMILLLIISISFSYKLYQVNDQKIFTVYFVPKHSAIEFINTNKSFVLIDSSLLQNKSQMLFRIKHNWWEKRIKLFNDIEFKTIVNTNNRVTSFENNSFLFIDSNYSTPNSILNIDYVIVSQNPKLYLKSFNKKIIAKNYIFDSSNNRHKEKYWKKECEELNLNCYFVNEKGAFVKKY